MQPLYSFLHYLSQPAIFLRPVTFHILFIYLNLKPRPDPLPAAWQDQAGWRISSPDIAPVSTGAAAWAVNDWRGIGPTLLEKLSQAGPTAAIPFPPLSSVILAFQWPLWALPWQTAAPSSCFVSCTSACRESFLACVPVSKGFHDRSGDRGAVCKWKKIISSIVAYCPLSEPLMPVVLAVYYLQ